MPSQITLELLHFAHPLVGAGHVRLIHWLKIKRLTASGAYVFLFVTYFAPLVILAAVAGKARSRVDLSIYFMLIDIIASMGHDTLGLILKLIAWLELFLVRVAVGTECFRVAEAADLLLLCPKELVAQSEISSMVVSYPPVCVTITAKLGRLYVNRVLPGHARVCRARDESCKRHREKKEYYVYCSSV